MLAHAVPEKAAAMGPGAHVPSPVESTICGPQQAQQNTGTHTVSANVGQECLGSPMTQQMHRGSTGTMSTQDTKKHKAHKAHKDNIELQVTKRV